jgi:4-hydroxybenzoate polyprenyltransferase
MNSVIKNLPVVLRSARLWLWLPILANVGILTFLLTHSFQKGFVLGISLSCVASYGFLINDIWDLQVDGANRAGKLESASKSALILAMFFSALFLSVGLIASGKLGLHTFVAMLIIAAGLTAYTFWVRPMFFYANLLAALLASAPIWLPNVVFIQQPNLAQWIIIAVAITILLGREIIFDIADAFGDAKAKRRTLPVLFGRQIATRIAVVWQLSACVLLVVFCATTAWDMPIDRLLLMCGTVTAFALLVIPINLKMLHVSHDAKLINLFTFRTRLAMLLLPLVMLALLNK